MIIIGVAFVVGVIVGILFIVLCTEKLEPKTLPTPKADSRIRDLSRLPPQSMFHGGAEEMTIPVQQPDVYKELVKSVQWEAEYNQFPDMDFFTIDLYDPEKLIIGRRYKIGDLVNNQIVIEVDGSVVKMLPPRQALAHLVGLIEREEIRKAEERKHGILSGIIGKQEVVPDSSELVALRAVKDTVDQHIVREVASPRPLPRGQLNTVNY